MVVKVDCHALGNIEVKAFVNVGVVAILGVLIVGERHHNRHIAVHGVDLLNGVVQRVGGTCHHVNAHHLSGGVGALVNAEIFSLNIMVVSPGEVLIHLDVELVGGGQQLSIDVGAVVAAQGYVAILPCQRSALVGIEGQFHVGEYLLITHQKIVHREVIIHILVDGEHLPLRDACLLEMHFRRLAGHVAGEDVEAAVRLHLHLGVHHGEFGVPACEVLVGGRDVQLREGTAQSDCSAGVGAGLEIRHTIIECVARLIVAGGILIIHRDCLCLGVESVRGVLRRSPKDNIVSLAGNEIQRHGGLQVHHIDVGLGENEGFAIAVVTVEGVGEPCGGGAVGERGFSPGSDRVRDNSFERHLTSVAV